MLLAIDVGNTNTVMGLYRLAGGAGETSAAEVIASWRITTPKEQTQDEFGVLLRNLFALRNLEIGVVTGVAVSSVVPPLDGMLRQAFELEFRVKPLFVEPGTRTGLPILTDNPAEVGADRIVNCVSAHARVKAADGSAPPVIVIDLGTATTFDAISARGEFLGGAIAPGLGISADALFARGARLRGVVFGK